MNVFANILIGNTPLHLLVRNRTNNANQAQIFGAINAIKEKGCDIDLRNIKGDTALHCAVQKRAKANAMWLIRLGADVTICNKFGASILYPYDLLTFLLGKEKQHCI